MSLKIQNSRILVLVFCWRPKALTCICSFCSPTFCSNQVPHNFWRKLLIYCLSCFFSSLLRESPRVTHCPLGMVGVLFLQQDHPWYFSCFPEAQREYTSPIDTACFWANGSIPGVCMSWNPAIPPGTLSSCKADQWNKSQQVFLTRILWHQSPPRQIILFRFVSHLACSACPGSHLIERNHKLGTDVSGWDGGASPEFAPLLSDFDFAEKCSPPSQFVGEGASVPRNGAISWFPNVRVIRGRFTQGDTFMIARADAGM